MVGIDNPAGTAMSVKVTGKSLTPASLFAVAKSAVWPRAGEESSSKTAKREAGFLAKNSMGYKRFVYNSDMA